MLDSQLNTAPVKNAIWPEYTERLSLSSVIGIVVRIEVQLRSAVAVLFVVLLVTSGSAMVISPDSDTATAADSVDKVELDNGSELWPYTSRSTDFDERTLAINLVVYGDTEATETLLREDAIGEWEDIDEDEQDIAPAEDFDGTANETTIGWGTADGAIRYTYVVPPDEYGRWVTESYQLGDGDYLGSRHHVRAYNDPAGGNWTAMQAHLDYWDWFHLRHNVPTTEDSQLYVESEFKDQWFVEGLHRVPFDNDRGADSDGWVTVIELYNNNLLIFLLGLLGSFSIAHWSRRLDSLQELRYDESVQTAGRILAVVAAIVGLYVLVRFGAIWTERLFPGANPKLIVSVFYPILIIGMPVVAYLLSRQLGSSHAFIAASAGFIIAIFVDFTYLAVLRLPLDMFIHRIALSVAIGFIAAGASQTAREPGVELGHVRTGALLWLVAISMPLLQFL